MVEKKDIRVQDAVTLINILSRFTIELELYCDKGTFSGKTKVRLSDVYLSSQETETLKKFLAGELDLVNGGLNDKSKSRSRSRTNK